MCGLGSLTNNWISCPLKEEATNSRIWKVVFETMQAEDGHRGLGKEGMTHRC